MLVLKRKSNESIVINGNILIKVVSIRGNEVRLGFEAPQEISIIRKELIEQAAKEASDETN